MSTSGSVDREGVGAGLGEQERRLLEVRGGRGGLGELRRELPEAQVLAAPVDEPERGGVPERRGAAVAEEHLVAVGEGEQLGQPVAQASDLELDPGLAVRRAEVVGRRVDQGRDCLRPHLGGAAAEPPVGGEQVGRDLDLGVAEGSPCHDREPGSSASDRDRRSPSIGPAGRATMARPSRTTRSPSCPPPAPSLVSASAWPPSRAAAVADIDLSPAISPVSKACPWR